MPSWLPSVAYPPPEELGAGYWGPVTSTLDWCEENYYATQYSAEIVNACTNLMFLYLGLKGIHNCVKNKHGTIFIVTYLGYLLVGFGSFCFHSSLKYPWQLVDELSMIYTTCIMFYATFAYGKSTKYGVAMGIFLLSLVAFITGYYHYIQDPTFHQCAYALLTAIVLLRSMYVMEINIRPQWKSKERALKQGVHANGSANGLLSGAQDAERRRRDERDIEILKTMWLMVAYGLSVFLGGFAIWSLDNKYCNLLRQARRELGLPWGILLEGHGWWHLMTGIGAYFYIQWGIWLRHCINGEQDQVEIVWPRLVTSFPIVERVKSQHNGLANGTANGIPNGVHKNLPNGVHKSQPNGVHKSQPNGVHKSLSNGVPNGTAKRFD